MMKSSMTALTLAGVLSISSLAAFAQSSGSTAPVDKGGMPPSTEMEAGSTSGSGASGNALPPGSVEGGNGGDASGSSTSPGTAGGAKSSGGTMGGGASDEGGGSGIGTRDSGGSGGSGGSSGSGQ